MSARQISNRYAKALYSVVPPGDLKSFADEFQKAVSVLQDPVIKEVFFHPRTTLQHKQTLVRSMQLSPLLEQFFLLTVYKSRDRYLQTMADVFEELVLQYRKTTVAQITSAVPLPEDTVSQIREHLQGLSGKTVIIQTKVDQAIGGGLVIQMDGQRIDGSVRGSLASLQRNLANC